MIFSKVLAALDFTKFDKTILSYLKYLIHPFGVKEMYFMHIVKAFALPKITARVAGDVLRPDYTLDERIKGFLKEEVSSYNLPLAKDALHFEVHEGRPVEQLVCRSEVRNIELVVVGNKLRHEGSGITPRRMAHRLKSSMLFLPEKSKTPIGSITVLVDYSTHSIKALNAANDLYGQINGIKVNALHIQEKLPPYQYPTSLHTKTNNGLTQERNLATFDKMLSENDLEKSVFNFVTLNQGDGSIAQTIKEYLAIHPTDLVILGSVGHHVGHRLLYGSTTESFVDIYQESPILVIR